MNHFYPGFWRIKLVFTVDLIKRTKRLHLTGGRQRAENDQVLAQSYANGEEVSAVAGRYGLTLLGGGEGAEVPVFPRGPLGSSGGMSGNYCL
jgi:hypothetical protein